MESIKLTFANPEVKKQWYAGRSAPTQEQATVSALRTSNRTKISMVNNDDDLILSIKSLINDTLTL